mmetsp:Transcript_19914/g.27639  ORF Transcript_19914/g.27639 Transcript_19914/m.27639 type:complete len:231 (-) Transcript_19914:96-788(-)
MLTIDYFLDCRDHRHHPVDRGHRNLFGHHLGHHRIRHDHHRGRRRTHHDRHCGHHIHLHRHDHHIVHHRIHHHDLHHPIGLFRCYDWGQHHPIGCRHLRHHDGLEASNGLLLLRCHRQNPRLDLKVLQGLLMPSPFLDVHVLVASLQVRLDASFLLRQPSYEVLHLDEHVLLRPYVPPLQLYVLPLLEQYVSILHPCVYGHDPLCLVPLPFRRCDRLKRILRHAWPLSAS